MWTYNENYNPTDSSSRIWNQNDDTLGKEDFDFYKQELKSVRFYSKCLSGATYLATNSLDDIYNILNINNYKNWYIGSDGSQYSISLIPTEYAESITPENSNDYYNKYLSEYGMTLKNLFTPKRLIDDSIKNFIYVDVATNEFIEDIESDKIGLTIDGVKLKEGHRILIKDQKSRLTLMVFDNPDLYFSGRYYVVENFGGTIEYEYFNNENGIYLYKNNKLIREKDLDDYEKCIRFSIIAKLGESNRGKQWHVVRLKNGYFPTTSENDPIEFEENHNYILRNKIDYNNLFEINYYDLLSNPTQSYTINDLNYSIPKRTIAVGEFGIILNHQDNFSHIIFNKYKVNLRGISQTTSYYWVCGDDGTILKIRKHDFFIEKIDIGNIKLKIKSISFYNDLKGVAVGEFNLILVTDDGGLNWEKLSFNEFDQYSYNKVIYYVMNRFFIGGDGGIFIEIIEDIDGWTAYRRRISKFDGEEDYLLIEHINDLHISTLENTILNLGTASYDLGGGSFLFIVTNNENIITYDLNNSISNGYDFYYFDLDRSIGDVKTITYNQGIIYFSSNQIYKYNFNNNYILPSSNIISTLNSSIEVIPFIDKYANKLISTDNLIICGNNSLFEYSDYQVGSPLEFDPEFENNLKSKLVFLDYDMGSKLNFFDDDQNYRLPNPLSITASIIISSTISFGQLENNSQYSQISINEYNWLNYYQDSLKTYEYMNELGINDNKKVVISFEFNYSTNSSIIEINTNSISNTPTTLAPTIDIESYSKFYRGTYSISIPTNTTPDLYLKDYLGILKVDINYLVKVGDVLEIDSDIIKKSFIVNKIINSGNNKYVYFFTEFNDNIITNIRLSNSFLKINNLNVYNSVSDFQDKFNIHPISIGYNINLKNDEIIINVNFNNMTAYYNMGTLVMVGDVKNEMRYKKGFINFGYSPTYNLLSYLEGINPPFSIVSSPIFYSEKEYLSMPIYDNIPIGELISTNLYVNVNEKSNKLYFGKDLKFEWETLLIYTFIDIKLNLVKDGGGFINYETKKLLITKKYFDKKTDSYVLEFHKKINLVDEIGNTATINIGSARIESRRKLKQISDDLQELNNIQKNILIQESPTFGSTFSNFQRELNFKFPTDSYAKILLSDVSTTEYITGVIYTDYKNEISLNITKLEQEITIPIFNTANFDNKLYIICSERHNLSTGDGVVLEFNGGTGSSQELNQQYFGFHSIIVDGEFSFYTNIEYGVDVNVGNDIGFVKYIKKDPFLNYYPIDLIDVGVDHKPKQSIELRIENLKLSNSLFKLVDIDFKKYRFRLVDGLDLETLSNKYPWILEAEISSAIIGMDLNKDLIWYKGIWECGRWFGGTWISGTWVSGDWYGGKWESKLIKDKLTSIEVDSSTYNEKYSQWFDGRWFGGDWNGGIWRNGRWYEGVFRRGKWYNGIWNDGQWLDGRFMGGIWVMGNWFNGIFNTDNEPAYWLDGKWYGGDFENGMWYNGIFEQKNGKSRFGVKSYNSRTSTWHGGKWISGSFHSNMNIDDDGNIVVSENHKYSIWYTGVWMSGDWYGGIAYNIDFRSGTWYGGILEDIQVIGIQSNDIMPSGSLSPSITLNGIFKFNNNDDVYIIDNNSGNEYSIIGNNQNPIKYKIIYTDEDPINKTTKIFIFQKLPTISVGSITPIDTKLRLVSKFKSVNWKSGIWTNGIYEEGLWEGGIWYNGIFSATWG
jgi:hypothetical protein